MPKFLEAKLKDEYGANSDIPLKVMNSMGVMHGNKITENGMAMDAKHEADLNQTIPTHNQRYSRKNFHQRSKLK